jgi:hypothetical protein
MNEKCAIMQPTFLPWAGYFNLISKVDSFIFLTDADYQKSSWHNRNRILVNGSEAWITCPIQRRRLGSPIYSIELQEVITGWREKLVRKIRQAYAKSPFKNNLDLIIPVLLDPEIIFLSDLNISLIKTLCAEMQLSSEFYDSMDFPSDLGRSARLEFMAKKVGASEYVSPVGARDYLMEDGVFDDSPICLSFQQYIPEPYDQPSQETFVSHLSIVDVICNVGLINAKDYVSGRYM